MLDFLFMKEGYIEGFTGDDVTDQYGVTIATHRITKKIQHNNVE